MCLAVAWMVILTTPLGSEPPPRQQPLVKLRNAWALLWILFPHIPEVILAQTLRTGIVMKTPANHQVT